MWQDHLRPCAVFTVTSEEFAPYYLAEIRHDMRQTTKHRVVTKLAEACGRFYANLCAIPFFFLFLQAIEIKGVYKKRKFNGLQ
jgi:hypothetical protein